MDSTPIHPASSPDLPSAVPGKIPPWLPVFFFAALFFFCSADQFFATRMAGLNFRWGQLLLLVAGLLSLKDHWKGFQTPSPDGQWVKKILGFWCLFFAAYALCALFSDNPKTTFLKWGWGLFNIGLAAALLLDKKWGDSLAKGFYCGAAAVAVTVWAQAIGIYWLGATAPSTDWRFTYPVLLHGFPFPLGYVQPGPNFGVLPILRLDAFYYEPSYAGCALAFAFPLVLVRRFQSKPTRFPWVPALVLSSIFLVGSRSGILSVLAGSAFFVAYGLFKPVGGAKPFFWRTVGTALLALALFCLSSSARWYMAFNFGLFKDRFTYGQLTDKKTSEGGRLASILRALQLWKAHPLLGDGVPQNSPGDQGVTVTTEDMWLEIAMESGVLGLLAFGIALGGTLGTAWARGSPGAVQALVLAAWVSHFVVNMNLCQTYPRLDFWLIFFLSIRLLAFPLPQAGPKARS